MTLDEMRERARQGFSEGAARLAEDVTRMLDSGMPTDDIAAAIGVQHKTVATRLRRNGYTEELDRLNRRRIAEAEERTGRRIANGRYAA